MIATGESIKQYIPQREPMMMIHDLLEADAEHAVSSFHIAADNIFVEEGKFREPGLVENIAQTAAAQAGYFFIQNKLPVPVGYIARIKNLRVHTLPDEGADLRTIIRVVNHVFEMTLVRGEVIWRGNLICECEMSIFAKKTN